MCHKHVGQNRPTTKKRERKRGGKRREGQVYYVISMWVKITEPQGKEGERGGQDDLFFFFSSCLVNVMGNDSHLSHIQRRN